MLLMGIGHSTFFFFTVQHFLLMIQTRTWIRNTLCSFALSPREYMLTVQPVNFKKHLSELNWIENRKRATERERWRNSIVRKAYQLVIMSCWYEHIICHHMYKNMICISSAWIITQRNGFHFHCLTDRVRERKKKKKERWLQPSRYINHLSVHLQCNIYDRFFDSHLVYVLTWKESIDFS